MLERVEWFKGVLIKDYYRFGF